MRRFLGGSAAALMALTIAVTPVLAANPGAKPGDSTIVEIVLTADGEFDVLEAAVIEAGLAGALSSDTQLTVFAPTDAAFVSSFRVVLGDDSVSESDVMAFIESGGVDAAFGDGALANILLYHVTHGRRTSNSVVHAPSYRMLNGDRLTRGQLLDAGIGAVDVAASNGVIHVINSVLLP
jgi:uncharacterized surface protein with fasciclin (FAS1) repeats